MITLTNKDADWIANICRKKLEEIDESYESVSNDEKTAYEATLKVIKLAGASSDQKVNGKSLDDVYAEAQDKLAALHNERRKEMERIIELMMTGSEE